VNVVAFAVAALALLRVGRGRKAVALTILVLTLALVGLNLYPHFPRSTGTTEGEPRSAGTVEETTRRSEADGEVYHRYLKRFHDHVYGIPENRTKWLAIDTLQNPNDAWVHQEIIADVKPDFIVETGTYKGGSSVLWAMILQQVNPRGRIITIDIEDYCQQARALPIWKEKVTFLKGSSTDPAIIADVAKRVKGGKVLVILDSDHSSA